MIGAPLTKHETLDRLETIRKSVDEAGRTLEEKWGVGRLPALVGIELAEKFRSQRRKFSRALWEQNLDDANRHGEAMMRAFAKLDAVAQAAGAERGPPDQWEFDTPDGLVILIRDMRRANQIKLDGRKAKIWSVDEIANVIRAHPILAAAKDFFPGAEIESVRPPIDDKHMLDDELADLPF